VNQVWLLPGGAIELDSLSISFTTILKLAFDHLSIVTTWTYMGYAIDLLELVVEAYIVSVDTRIRSKDSERD
jgi:hypothetical protein